MALVGPLPEPLRTDGHGVIRVGSSRVPLDVVVASYRAGATPEEMVIRHPTLTLPDVYAVVAY